MRSQDKNAVSTRRKGAATLLVCVLIASTALCVIPGAQAAPGDILRCSTDAFGNQSSGGGSSNASISADGRYVAFHSDATNLLPGGGDSNGITDVFRKDLATGAIVRCSTDAHGNQATQGSYNPSISADGRYVAFESDDVNLVPGDTNNLRDIFRKDLATGAIVRCSVGASGSQVTAEDCRGASISADGRYVAFQSKDANLLPVGQDTNGQMDVFRKDVDTSAIVRCSTDAYGNQASGGGSSDASISADGRYVAFQSDATNLLPGGGDSNGKLDVFRKDVDTSAIVRCSTNAYGNQANGHSASPCISADGRYVAFRSDATNLMPDTVNGWGDVYRKDVVTSAIVRCSTDAHGNEADGGESYTPSISADGRYVAFYSTATNLVPSDGNGLADAFRKDIATSAIVRCNTDALAAEATGGNTWDPSLSADGRYAAFHSDATNLLPGGGDSNGLRDVFRKELALPPPVLDSVSPDSGQVGDEVTLAGHDFRDLQFDSFVSFGGVKATEYISWSETEIKVKVPAVEPGPTQVIVITAGGISNAREFTIPTIFYFAEGYTGGNFREYLCLGQPVDAPLEVKVTYLFRDGSSQEEVYFVPALSRFTVNVNDTVGPDKEVSIICEADYPFIAERPIYFNYQDRWTGGHDAVGATSTSRNWYFAEGYTGQGFDEYVCVLNPGDDPADLTFYFQTQEEGEKIIPGLSVAPHSRQTFKANTLLEDKPFQTSLKLESSRPVVAERPMYFDYTGTGNWHWTGGHCVMGATSLASEYFFAEGTTRAGFEEWITLQNPGLSPITVKARYLLASGGPIENEYIVNPAWRSTIYVPLEVGAEQDVSVFLSCDSPFLAERPMYFNYQGTGAWGWTGGHCVMGATSAATDWFFAEGYTGSGFEEWLCIQNNGSEGAEVTISYYPEGAASITRAPFTVKPNSRDTILVNLHAGPDLAISCEVASNKPIICERPMYFNYNGVWTGGHDVVGYVP